MYLKIETDEQIDTLVEIAGVIWREHFGPMFGSPEMLEQVIEQVQSKRAICEQLKDGYLYYFIQGDDAPVGYFAYRLDKEKDEMFLSKIYLLQSQRGKGKGRNVLSYLKDICREGKVSKISLTVLDKNMDTVRAYEKWGFKHVADLVRDFGKGLICNDFIMEYYL